MALLADRLMWLMGLMGQTCLYNKLFNRADPVDPRMPVLPTDTRQKEEYSRRSKVAQGQHGLLSELSSLERRPVSCRGLHKRPAREACGGGQWAAEAWEACVSWKGGMKIGQSGKEQNIEGCAGHLRV